jgi:ribosomal protein S12 methylthiotransferase
MEIQQGISYQLNQQKIGKKLKVLVDKKEGEYYIARTEFDSPEVDNEVLIKADENYLRIGDFAEVEITGAEDYDLYGKLI